MAEQLFPVFDVPEIQSGDTAEKRRYSPSVSFDYDSGDFLCGGSGNMTLAEAREAYIQWCMKLCMTERFTCLSYGKNIGVDMLDALANETRPAIESAIERTITEALMINPKTEYLRDFQFAWHTDNLYCSFLVKARDWDEARLKVEIQK